MRATRKLGRRGFLGGAAAVAAFNVIPRHVLGSAGEPSANNKLNIAGIGVGGMGSHDIRSVPGENIVAVCDVDAGRAAEAAKPFPWAKIYTDYREMLQSRNDIDAVMVATPDHSHAAVTMAALKMGKHVFCQKPLTHSVYEALQVAKAAREAKRATQMGNQGQAGEGARLVSEYIWSGSIGKVRAIHGWSNRRPDISPRGIPRPKDTPPVPANLNWDLWIGPAPMRPYHPCYHPFAWRGWWDFGTGVLGDIGCHNLSAAFKALKLGWPESVEACSTHWNAPPEIKDETAPAASIVTYRFAPEGDRPELTIQWYDGGMMPPLPREFGAKTIFADDGTLIVGDEGMLLNERLVPEARAREVGKPPQKLPRSPGHYKEWTDACKGGPPAGSNFVDHAGHLAAVVLLGNIAIRTQQKLFWDAEKLQFKDNPEANRLLQPPYRDGWSL
ncbi:MAG TPA: Gfo/Idh/MocA family oxidoreductase [Planctomycetota bacterium]|jgi:predicted dehydrogenase|nr:Gfo/Idh/MocA family oxidoreductase [Planctomycetota bacterium]OQC21804.1 MAG: Inositol 2-dehydrogenase [Planctomycetes bacterium ADurb.Bin069]NMD34381.1 Gfo/Idh/MocA family oxidoreductase [Planctomycetota bacterium]HNR98245.1 Gfo/Idh/MocA family oxidoreductase [Planctomycetota bacterium]HNU24886.1 Gfo/Idh/MocA family oxidoreductase [Planctomycetota bacterium]